MNDKITISYEHFVSKSEETSGVAKKSIIDDVAFGTHKSLFAADSAANSVSWKSYKPTIRNFPNFQVADQRFELYLSPEQFNIESEGIDHFIATIAGDILENTNINDIVVGDFDFPERYSYFVMVY